MFRIVFISFIFSILSCGSNTNEPTTILTGSFQQKRQDSALDQTIQPLLNQYFAVLQHFQAQDSADWQLYGKSLSQMADSLTQQRLSTDSVTNRNAIQGLLNIQSEMEAILIETANSERIFGLNMLSLHWIELLASIGYQKQTIYIFSDQEGNQWISLNKKATNPYNKNDQSNFEAIQILQEL